MSRTARAEVYSPQEIAVVHVMNRVVRRCFLMGDDPLTGRNFDHRKLWIENRLRLFAANFGIDLLNFAILSNHFHLVLRSRPDVVATWDDTQVSQRWLQLCPVRKRSDGSAEIPTEAELNSIRRNPDRLIEIRDRLSDISWWMRLLDQYIAERANREEDESGKFWQNRFVGTRLLDEASILACSAYVDLNPIRAAIAETIELSDHTSAQLRARAIAEEASSTKDEQPESSVTAASARPDAFIAPVQIDALRDALGAQPSSSAARCSDKGFLEMTAADYLSLLDWTSQHAAGGKKGVVTPSVATPPILARLGLKPEAWLVLTRKFGRMFYLVAGWPGHVDAHRGRLRHGRFHLPSSTRQMLSA